MENRKVLSTGEMKNMKVQGNRIAMVTAYDYPSAQLAEEAGADIILVGDSLGMVVLGYDSTVPVTMEDMLHHTKAVTRAATKSFVLADMPFLSYHGSIDRTLHNAARLMQEGLVKAIKMEGGAEISEVVSTCVKAGIPVMGHIGLTPQAVHQLGGYKVQGRQPEQASKLIQDALALEQAGVFALVLEMVPEELSQYITETVSIPTIGIGAGRYCDGQVLVFHDVLQYASPVTPKFVKPFADVGSAIKNGISNYIREVKEKSFPSESHVYNMDRSVLDKINSREMTKR